MHAIGKDRPRSKDALIFSTQSTHKLLAGLSQASQILVQYSETRQLDRYRFNEAYLMHTSTSPQYAIIASCDVGRGDDGAAGRHCARSRSRSPRRSTSAARCARSTTSTATRGGSRCGGPDRLAEEGIGDREDWMIRAEDTWHGFGDLAPGFNMLDPIKATVLTPGIDVQGDFADVGIRPRSSRSTSAEHGVIVEKTGLYSFFIMFTIGITKGRWNTLLTALQQFKSDYDGQPAAVARAARVRAGAPALREDRPARPVRQHPRHLPRERHRPAHHRDLPVEPRARDEARGRVRAHGAPARSSAWRSTTSRAASRACC
jgi:arginine decarboxylase